MATSASSLSNLLSANSGSAISTGNGAGGATGFGQGIDVNSFVQLALSGIQANITNVQNQQSTISTEQSALSTITADLRALQTATTAIQDPLGAVGSELATSSDPTLLAATAQSTATAGTHTIAINSLATTSSFYSDAVTASSTPLATGNTISISVGGNQVASVTVDSTNNMLTQIASAINGQTSAVQANVVNDATGARLVLVSATSGVPGNLTITGSLSLPDSTPIAFHQAAAGLNAALTVDGVPISSSSNTIGSVINGVTLNLNGTTGNNPVTVTVTPDTSTISAAINQFVSAYNTAIGDLNAQFQVGASGTAGTLEADGSVRDAQQALLGAITYSTNGSGGAVNLTNLGISVNDDGTLTVDSGTLSSALASNISGVQAFLQDASAGFANNMSTVLSNLTGPISGTLTLDANGLTQTSQDLSQQVSDLQANMAVQQQNLVAIYAQVNTTLQTLPLLQTQLSQQLASI